jgi:hypothetical protein
MARPPKDLHFVAFEETEQSCRFVRSNPTDDLPCSKGVICRSANLGSCASARQSFRNGKHVENRRILLAGLPHRSMMDAMPRSVTNV